jgi:hypothetical protein
VVAIAAVQPWRLISMTLNQLRASLQGPTPPTDLVPPLAALWWSAKGDWNKAHALVMDEESREAAWVHAYLHRVEGDLGNARYWYGQARRAPATVPLEAEWVEIAEALL